MTVRTIALIGLCAVMAACNSEPAEEAPPTTEASVAPSAAPAQAPVAMQPAPEGLPSRIAGDVITASGQACASVASAERGDDGTITATCSSGESYQVYTDAAQNAVAVAR
ncbi:MAG: hypothetical protein ACO1OD_05835 [Croceibacterium sp.]